VCCLLLFRDLFTSQESLASVKKTSKWDKPDRPAPPPVNRLVEEEETESKRESDTQQLVEINPPADITKNLLSKFRELEQSKAAESVAVDRRPVRQFTPPRELETRSGGMASNAEDEDVSASDKGEESLKDEMPPPAITKNLLARFSWRI